MTVHLNSAVIKILLHFSNCGIDNGTSMGIEITQYFPDWRINQSRAFSRQKSYHRHHGMHVNWYNKTILWHIFLTPNLQPPITSPGLNSTPLKKSSSNYKSTHRENHLKCFSTTQVELEMNRNFYTKREKRNKMNGMINNWPQPGFISQDNYL